MGLFDNFNDLLGAITEPLKDITEVVNQVKEDAVSSFSQIGDDVNDFKDQGTAAVGDLKNSVSDILPRKPDQ